MRYLSVCSGIEAATVAWHPLGFSPVAFAGGALYGLDWAAAHGGAGDRRGVGRANWHGLTDQANKKNFWGYLGVMEPADRERIEATEHDLKTWPEYFGARLSPVSLRPLRVPGQKGGMSDNVQPDRRVPATDRRLVTRGGRRETDGVPKFTCARCGHGTSKVTRGRPRLGEIEEIYRRTRVCLLCGFVYRTRETIEVD